MRDYYMALLPLSLKGCALNIYGVLMLSMCIFSGYIVAVLGESAVRWACG